MSGASPALAAGLGAHTDARAVAWFAPPAGQPVPQAAPKSGHEAWRRRGRALLREPLTHFLAAGLLIFAASHALDTHSQRYTIELGPSQLRRIAATYEQQYGASPTAAELKALTDEFVRQEVLLREGAALGLDRDDEIVRRRVAQKMEFLLQDRAVPRQPSEADLRSWFADHRADYALLPRRSFDQMYFAADRRGEAAARQLAESALRELQHTRVRPHGDTFPGPAVIRLLSQNDTDRLFGDAGFAARVFAAPPGAWAGPFRSAFGWHLVRVSELQPAQAPSFAEVRDRVAADWKRADAAAGNQAAFAEIRRHYRVVARDHS